MELTRFSLFVRFLGQLSRHFINTVKSPVIRLSKNSFNHLFFAFFAASLSMNHAFSQTTSKLDVFRVDAQVEISGCVIDGQLIETSLPQIQCDAMLALSNNFPAYWRSQTDPCSWGGVACKDGGVVGIVAFAEADGELPAELGDLTDLVELQLQGFSERKLSGPISRELGRLNKLKTLILSGNALSGSIPEELGDLNNLTILDLSENTLSGSISSDMVNLFERLTSIRLEGNRCFSATDEALVAWLDTNHQCWWRGFCLRLSEQSELLLESNGTLNLAVGTNTQFTVVESGSTGALIYYATSSNENVVSILNSSNGDFTLEAQAHYGAPYTVTLTAEDSIGKVATLEVPVNVTALPAANATVPESGELTWRLLLGEEASR